MCLPFPILYGSSVRVEIRRCSEASKYLLHIFPLRVPLSPLVSDKGQDISLSIEAGAQLEDRWIEECLVVDTLHQHLGRFLIEPWTHLAMLRKLSYLVCVNGPARKKSHRFR